MTRISWDKFKVKNINKELRATTENSDQWDKIKEEIVRTEEKIDQEVYKLYGLMEGERGIVESF